VAPAVALFPLLILAAWIALAGILKTWNVSFGQMLQGLANLIDRIHIGLPGVFHAPSIHFHSIANAFRYADRSVRNAIGAALTWTGQPLAVFIEYMATVFAKPAEQLAGVVGDLAHTIGSLRRQIIPAMIAARVAWIPRHLAALAAKLVALAEHVPRAITHEIVRTRHYVTKVVVHAVAAPTLPRIGRIEREAAAEAGRVRSLARRVGLLGAAGLIATALGTLGLGWLRCSRVKTAGKQVCGMDSNLLDSLLADTLLIVGTVSLVEFAEGLQAGMNEFTPQIKRFWRA
jgi:hypothetical protein